jgi:hypothetical protein
VVRVIELSRARVSGALGVVSKLDRDPSFITGLIAHGEERAEEFLVALAFERARMARDVEATLRFRSSRPTRIRGAVSGTRVDYRRGRHPALPARSPHPRRHDRPDPQADRRRPRYMVRPMAPARRDQARSRRDHGHFHDEQITSLTLTGRQRRPPHRSQQTL